jgi:hypothetical protein
MPRPLLILVVAGALAGLAAAPAGAATAKPYATRLTCHTGVTSDQRYMDVRASMHAVPGTVRMAVRFDVQERVAPALVFSPAAAPDLGVWNKSKKKVNPYNYDQVVKGLDAPAAYRTRVGFRWYGKHDKVLKSVHRTTRICGQPDLRPDLSVKNVIVGPPTVAGNPWRYTVVVRNDGRSAAGAFDVAFAPPDGAVQTAPIAGLQKGDQTRVTFTGPACRSAAPPAFTVDSTNAVDESDETDNQATATC